MPRPAVIGAIARHELRLLTAEPDAIVILIAMPIIVIAFLKPTFRLQLFDEGYSGASGAEQAVPGVAVLFAFFILGFVAQGYYREQSWQTWERLRSAPITTLELLVGKCVAPVALVVVQLAVLFAAGVVLFDLDVRGSVPALAIVGVVLALCLTSLGWLLVAFARSFEQANALVNAGAILLAGFGGALVPASTLPDWARAIGHVTPSWWAMQGFRDVTLDGAGVADVWPSVVVLLAWTGGAAVVAARRLRAERAKRF